MINRTFLLAVGLMSVIALSSCGTGSQGAPPPPPPPKPDFLYAMTPPGPGSSSNLQLATYKVDAATGALSSSGVTSFSGFAVPQIAINPASKYLYVSFPSSTVNTIGIFTIDPNSGIPTQTSIFNLTQICLLCPPISGPGVLSMDPNGKYLFYGSSTLGAGVFEGIGALSVSATGVLSGVNGSPFPGDQAPFQVRVDPTAKFLYTENIDPTGVAGIALQSISGFTIDPNTGALIGPVPGSPYTPPVSATIGGITIHSTGKFLYASTGFGMNGIMGWSIDAAGGLTPLSGSPFNSGTAAFGAGTFDPVGKFFYVSGGPSGGILGFSIDASGNLTPLASSPFAAGSSLTSPVIDPTGKFLFAGDTLNKAIVTFSMDPSTGALTQVGAPFQTSAAPIVLTIVKAP